MNWKFWKTKPYKWQDDLNVIEAPIGTYRIVPSYKDDMGNIFYNIEQYTYETIWTWTGYKQGNPHWEQDACGLSAKSCEQQIKRREELELVKNKLTRVVPPYLKI